METYEQKRRRLYGKLDMSKYLIELKTLTNTTVKLTNLTSIVEMDEFRKELPSNQYFSKTIKFDDKKQLKEILINHLTDWEVPYYLSTYYSNCCGMFKIPTFHVLNLNFGFKDESQGLFTVIREDREEEVIFDFFEENGEELITIKILKK